jgi:predicted esterase
MKNKYHLQRLLLFAAFLSVISVVYAQEDYRLKENILYRDSEAEKTDKYISERCRLDLYYPETKGFTTVVWFHGGGITSGNKFIPEKLKQQGIAVVAVNYRLSPKVNCPAYIEDAAAAVAWTFKNIKNYGGDPSKIVVSGHSAGGYLTTMVGLDKKWLARYKIDANNIAMLIPFSGHTITHMTVILITGDREREMLGRYEENAYMWRMMKVAGHTKAKLYELDSFDHGGMASPAYEILLNEIKALNK